MRRRHGEAAAGALAASVVTDTAAAAGEKVTLWRLGRRLASKQEGWWSASAV